MTIEDDEALRGLQLLPPVLQIAAAESADVTIAPTQRHHGRSSCTTPSRPPSIPMAHQRRAR